MNCLKMLGAAVLLFTAAPAAMAAEPDGYYSSCENKSGAGLLSALCSKIRSHTTIGYDGLWNVYKVSDVRSDGTLWDMYSTKRWPTNFTRCGNYSSVGDCVNREHSMPKSWFSNRSPMNSDAFHVYPTDGKVNGQRSNFPYGECAGGTTLPGSGSVKALGRLGTCTSPGYTGKVFEPDDEYKGDFARTYFYMAACYNENIRSWTSDMFAGNSYPAFKTWAINVLLKWHREDPVSQKERDRNEAVYGRQKNRNPFIDHPELAEYIWGNKKDQPWTLSGDPEPRLILPVDGSSVDLGTTVAGVRRSCEVKVQGADLASDVSLAVSGAGFDVTPAQLGASAAQAGSNVTVTFNPAAEGQYSGTLTVSSGSLRSVVSLSGKAIATLPAGPVTTVSAESFVATWSYVGDADASGRYTLDVRRGGASIAGYPRQVAAAAESYAVTGLDPETAYTYTVASSHLVSDAVTVTTGAPTPSVDFLYDSDPVLHALPGEPSEAAELLVEIEYIYSAINVKVEAPFQISTDKASWSTSLDLDPEEDRMYLRVYSQTPGTFRTALTATSGTYFNDDAEFEAVVAVPGSDFAEDFENPGEGTYSSHTYTGKMCDWGFDNAGMWKGDKTHTGQYAVRMGKEATSQITMLNDHRGGFGTVTLWAAHYNADGNATVALEYSTDGGESWKPAGEATITGSDYRQYSFAVNVAGSVRMRVRQLTGKRFMLDDIEATAYGSGVVSPVEDYHTWDAYARDGHIVIETSEAVEVAVYALDGTVLLNARVNAGSTTLDVPAGLYIVSVADFARRVLVK